MIRLLSDTKKKLSWPPEDTEKLSQMLRERARRLNKSDMDSALEADAHKPGYLRRDFGSFFVWVPFPLARAFPPHDIVLEIVELLEELAVGQKSSICISGSTAFIGQLKFVGDLDLCEYLLDGGTIPQLVTGHLSRHGVRAHLAKIKCHEDVFLSPFPGCADRVRDLVAQGVPRGTDPQNVRKLKFDFCAIAERLGIIPASNVVLWLSPEAPETGNALASFAHQEAVVDRGEGVARTLIDPDRLGAYLAFLEKDANNYLETNPIKAVKRSLSLTAMLGLSDWYDRAVDILNEPVVGLIVRARRTKELEELVAVSAEAVKSRLVDLLTREQAVLAEICVDEEDVRAVEAVAREFALGFLTVLGEFGTALERKDG
jgi:hypothetical protein